MNEDPILEELWRIREEQSASYGHDIHRMMADSRRQQYLEGCDIWARSKITGQMEVVFKGSGKPSHASGAESADHLGAQGRSAWAASSKC
jgi:hypothetical protein